MIECLRDTRMRSVRNIGNLNIIHYFRKLAGYTGLSPRGFVATGESDLMAKRRYTSQDRKTGFKFGGGKIWESKDGRYLYRYIYSNIHGKKSRSLMRAKMPGWHGVKSSK